MSAFCGGAFGLGLFRVSGWPVSMELFRFCRAA